MGEIFAGRYELLDPIAEGGMGTVWTVHDRQTNEIKAAKMLRQSDAASLLRFVREQSMRIAHDHVVTPDSWAGVDDRVLFTMPLVRGGSVAGLIRNHGPLPVRWVAVLLDQTLAALSSVHAAGIVHRDIKPANLLLEPTAAGRPHLRVTDFGIAAPVDEPRMTQAFMSIGTPGYMAPEQAYGSHPDPRQDIYAVGAVGLELLTGQRPPAEGLIEVPDLPPTDPRAPLAAVLARAVATDPQQRHESAARMRAELAELHLIDAPPAPDEQPIIVADSFGTPSVPTEQIQSDPTGYRATALGPTASVTALLGAGPVPAPAPRSSTRPTWPGFALIGAGVAAWIIALLLLF